MIDQHHIVFLCVANSARSQMAEGLARASAPADWTVSSAGSDPGRLNPQATMAMAEIGIDISHQRSKGLDQVPLDGADVVVTLCEEEACPTTPPEVLRLNWPIRDPARPDGDREPHLEAFRAARDELQERIAGLWDRVSNGSGI